MLRFAIAFSSMLVLAQEAQRITPARIPSEPKDAAWTAKIEFEPIHKQIRGIPIVKLDPSWIFASELMEKGFPKEAFIEDDGDSMKNSEMGFSKFADFDGDGQKELALVGVFKRRTGELGNFILILKKGKGSKWEKAFLESWPGKPGFMAFALDKPGIEIWYCMECDDSATLKWDPAKKQYAWEKEEDQQ
jgi:hypothetical protein